MTLNHYYSALTRLLTEFYIFQIDAIDRTSWQAQIKGRKEWTLEPPPECYFECPPLHSTILETGDICELFSIVPIVIIDIV